MSLTDLFARLIVRRPPPGGTPTTIDLDPEPDTSGSGCSVTNEGDQP